MELVPERSLRRADVVVLDLHHPLDVIAHDREREVAHAGGAEGVGRDATDLGHDRLAGLQRAAIVAHPSGSTPITRIRSSNHAAIPASGPPPPQLIKTVSTSGTCSSTSSPIVPWPAITSGWSNGCISSAPVSACRSPTAACASAQ